MTESPDRSSSTPDIPDRSARNDNRASLLWLKIICVAILLLHLPAFTLVKIADNLPPPQPPPPAFIQFQDFAEDTRERLLEEQALLLDSEPLFLPTQWNYASQASGNVRLPALSGAPFTSFPEQLHLGQIDFFPETTRPAIPDLSDTIVQVATTRNNLFSGFGTAELSPRPLSNRQAFLRFHHLGEQPFVIERIMRAESGPEAIHEELWQPATVLIQIGVSGLLGPPTLTHSTGNAEIDQHILDYLQQPESIRDLPQGYYQITAGP